MVTGCAGFIGSHVIDKLLWQGYDVKGIDCFTDYYSRALKESNISQALRNKKFSFINKNIMDIDAFPEVDYVFHLSAQAGVRASWGKSFEIYTKCNIEATQKLLEFYKNTNVKKFVYSSSSSVYGDVALPMVETVMLRPISPYGVTKLAAEHLCYLYWKNFGLPTVSLRYFTVYGPRQRPDMAINKFFTSIINNKEITIYGDGNQTRDFTYVDDAVNANVLSASSIYNGEVFNVGGGSRISVNDLVALIEKVTGKNAICKYVESQKGDVQDTQADTTRLREKLKWCPKINIEDGIKNYYKWYIKIYRT